MAPTLGAPLTVAPDVEDKRHYSLAEESSCMAVWEYYSREPARRSGILLRHRVMGLDQFPMQ